MMFFGLRKSKKVHNWAAQAKEAAGEVSAPVISFIVPVIPVIMAAAFGWPTLPSFLFATLMALVLTGRVIKQPKTVVDLLSKTLYDGFADVGPVSYTHLDVYKRQIIRFLPFLNPHGPRPGLRRRVPRACCFGGGASVAGIPRPRGFRHAPPHGACPSSRSWR